MVAQRRYWTQPSRGGQSPSGQGDHSMGISSRQGQHTTPARCRTACCRSSSCHPWWCVRDHAKGMSLGQTLSPSELLAKLFIEWRQAQVDDGVFLTESLAEVSSQQEESAQTDDHTQADFVREGSKAVIRVRRTKVKSTMPATTEQLHKYRLLAVHWVCSHRDTPTSPGPWITTRPHFATMWTGYLVNTLRSYVLCLHQEKRR